MISKRWDPGIRDGDRADLILHDQLTNGGIQGLRRDGLEIVMGIRKEIFEILWILQIRDQRRGISGAIKMDRNIFTGCNLDCDYLISLFYLIGIDLLYLIGDWVLWYLWRSRSGTIKSRRYGLIVRYLVPSHHGNYRGGGETSRYRTSRRDEGSSGATGAEGGGPVARSRPSMEQLRGEQRQRNTGPEVREEGEIQGTGAVDAATATEEFQLELAKTQAEGSEAIMEATKEEMGLLQLRGMRENQDDMELEAIDMELEALNATLLESGVELAPEDEFQTLSEEEAEKVSEFTSGHEYSEEMEGLVCGEDGNSKDTETGDMARRQGHRKRLFKPIVNTAGSNKMRTASALLSPRKRAVAKVGTRHGDNGKPPESKGTSYPKQTNLKL
ncbi:hypothetical protein IGI04_018354 [Brassica rapa subsp. trilocularis]|uniref:Uncharacterized protein n=1 Tax=Brassica rapa subsp. trilocularis TaxID=1813537 RepID=A0ABQ7MCQ3_BRACM|nr:hypothetical protein IGI04_018354 [Brassica rapa subsp. trilocularis]